MTLMKVAHSGETVLFPPRLPNYLSDAHKLKPIVGKPADEDVKAIHAVIRSQNTMAHSKHVLRYYDLIGSDGRKVSSFHNPDLSMQLSQHLFGAQLAIYRATYSTTLLPGERGVYTPPTLPSHVPGTLHEIVGAPSNEDIKSVQGVVRTLDNLANSPHLFDADLSMKLSQHMFDLHADYAARYMHDSSEGNFVSKTEPDELPPAAPQRAQALQEDNPAPYEDPDPQDEGRIDTPAGEDEEVPKAPSELAQLGETMKAIQDATNESKGFLKNMNQVLTLIQKDQCSIAAMDKYYHMYKNPVNRRGISASECGLPQLRYGYYQNGLKYAIYPNDNLMVRYLKFFDIGADLIQGGENPKLIKGKYGEAEKLILKEIGVGPYH